MYSVEIAILPDIDQYGVEKKSNLVTWNKCTIVQGAKSGSERTLLVNRFSSALMATLSNCGNTLKLSLPSWTRKRSNGQGNDLGYGNNEKDAYNSNGQSAAKS